MQRSTSKQSTGRRSYNRANSNNSNCFKFHNFVFNEDNHSFCLEEQHGNKKITVLHWKKSEEKNEDKPDNYVRTSDSDSYLLKCAKTSQIPSLLACEEQESADSANKRRNTGVTSSASFPLTFAHMTSQYSAHPWIHPVPPTPPCFTFPTSTSSAHQQSSPLLRQQSTSSATQCDLSSPHSNYSLRKSSEEILFKSNNSSSSIATTTSSSSSHLNQQSPFSLNQSLHDLELTENIYRPGNRRKPHQVRRIVLDDNSSSDNDEEFETETCHSRCMNDDIKRPHQNYLSDIQTQPLDLSTKSKSESNCNIDSVFTEHSPMFKVRDMHQATKCKDMFCTSEHPSSSGIYQSDINPIDSLNRSESVSPSVLISSIKCCSPPLSSSLQTENSKHSTTNMFSMPSFGSCTSLLETNSANKMQQPISEMFDTFLEEEINKFLQSSSMSTGEEFNKSDIDNRIEHKLWLLQQEVLNRKTNGAESLYDANRDNQNHIKLHFKLDANKNLEPYETSKQRCQTGQGTTQSSMMFKSRMNQRNQIKRQLEDAFKQNGFLVKVILEQTNHVNI